jgi:serine/threonine protein kinase
MNAQSDPEAPGNEPPDAEPRLTALACSVSDRAAVDWASATAQGLGPGLIGLQTLDRLAAAFDLDRSRRPEIESLFQWGPLEVLEKIGAGQFGEVYRAWDPNLGRQVALKLGRSGPDGSHLPRKRLDEARRLARVRHPNVLTVFGAAVHDGRAGIWTDLLEGSTLEERLEQDGPLGAGELVLVGTELCRALAAVHDAGLVHGDVKTSNVVRELGGGLVLVDFGAAHSPREGAPQVIQGTPSYLAPEVASGRASPTPGSDLYALGALLYRLATDEFWRGAGSRPLGDARPDLPTQLVGAIESLLAEAVEARPRSAGEALRRLADPSPAATNGEPGRPLAPRITRLSIGLAMGIALIVLVVLGGQRLGKPSDSSPAPRPLAVQLSSVRGNLELPLGNGSTLRPGDRLNLRVELAEPTHVYVFNEDQAGELFVLFPLPGMESQNPLAPGPHRLPGSRAGVEQSWVVTSAGGTETFLVIGSTTETPEVRHFLDQHQRARSGRSVDRAVEKPPKDGDTLRGIGGLEPSSPSSGRARLVELQESLAAKEDHLWTELLVLENPR